MGMKLKACAHLADNSCLMNSIPFPVLYNVLSRTFVSQRLKRNEVLRKTVKAYDHMSLKGHYAPPVLIISCFYVLFL